MDDLQKLWSLLETGVAGAIGASLIAFFRRKTMKLKESIAYVFFGFVAAHWVAPLISNRLNLAPESVTGVGFIIGSIGGTLGMWAVNFVLDGELTALIKSRFGKSE